MQNSPALIKIQEELESHAAVLRAVNPKTIKLKTYTNHLLRYHLTNVKKQYLLMMEKWRDNRGKVQELNSLVQMINNKIERTGPNAGQLVMTQELYDKMMRVRDVLNQLGPQEDPQKQIRFDFSIKKVGEMYSKEDRDPLMDTLKSKQDELNIDGDMKMQQLQQFYNERLETFQYARSIVKPEHDSTQQVARNIGGKG